MKVNCKYDRMQKWNLVRSPVTGHPVCIILHSLEPRNVVTDSFVPARKRPRSCSDSLLHTFCRPVQTAKINKKLNIFRTMTIFFRARKGKRAFSPSGRFPALKFRFWWGHVELCKERANPLLILKKASCSSWNSYRSYLSWPLLFLIKFKIVNLERYFVLLCPLLSSKFLEIVK